MKSQPELKHSQLMKNDGTAIATGHQSVLIELMQKLNPEKRKVVPVATHNAS